MNRIEQQQKRKKESQIRKDLERNELESDIKQKAELCRKFVNDKRYAEYKDYWEGIILILQNQYQNLAESVKNNEDFLRQGIKIATQIQTIKWILNEPGKFIEMETKIKESEEKQ